MPENHLFPPGLLDPANVAYASDSRVRLLVELSETLSRAATLVEVADASMVSAKKAFPDSAATMLCRVTESGEDLEIFAVSNLPGQVFEKWQCFPVNSNAPIAHAVAHRRVIVLESPSDWQAAYPHLSDLLAETGHRAQLVVPLVAGGAATGAIGIVFNDERTFGADDVALASTLAGQCAIALERARLFENEKHAREVAENANRVKSDFLTSLSHELRTPVGAIGGYAELIQMGVHGPVTDSQHEALRRIQSNQKHIKGLIDAVLEFSRIDAGVARFDITDVDLDETIEMCEAVISPLLEQKKLTYARSIASKSVVVRADVEKLRQILINLLTNAVKYTDSPGKVTVSVVEDENHARVTAADTGNGVDEGQVEAIFQPFVRLPNKSGSVPGVGLGLAICRSFARAMDAELTVQSRVGQGSAFTLKLPRSSSITPVVSPQGG